MILIKNCFTILNHEEYKSINIIDKIDSLAAEKSLKYFNQSVEFTYLKKKLAADIVDKLTYQIYKGKINFNKDQTNYNIDNIAKISCKIYDKIYSKLKLSNYINDDLFKKSIIYQINLYILKKYDQNILENIQSIAFLPFPNNFFKFNFTKVTISFFIK